MASKLTISPEERDTQARNIRTTQAYKEFTAISQTHKNVMAEAEMQRYKTKLDAIYADGQKKLKELAENIENEEKRLQVLQAAEKSFKKSGAYSPLSSSEEERYLVLQQKQLSEQEKKELQSYQKRENTIKEIFKPRPNQKWKDLSKEEKELVQKAHGKYKPLTSKEQTRYKELSSRKLTQDESKSYNRYSKRIASTENFEKEILSGFGEISNEAKSIIAEMEQQVSELKSTFEQTAVAKEERLKISVPQISTDSINKAKKEASKQIQNGKKNIDKATADFYRKYVEKNYTDKAGYSKTQREEIAKQLIAEREKIRMAAQGFSPAAEQQLIEEVADYFARMSNPEVKKGTIKGKDGTLEEVMGLKIGTAKDNQKKSVLATRHFKSFLTDEGQLISGYKINSDTGEKTFYDSMAIHSEDKRLAEAYIDDKGRSVQTALARSGIKGVSNLQDASLTQLEKVYEELQQSLAYADSDKSKYIEEAINVIEENVYEAFQNTVEPELREKFINTLQNLKFESFEERNTKPITINNEEEAVFARSSTLANNLRERLAQDIQGISVTAKQEASKYKMSKYSAAMDETGEFIQSKEKDRTEDFLQSDMSQLESNLRTLMIKGQQQEQARQAALEMIADYKNGNSSYSPKELLEVLKLTISSILDEEYGALPSGSSVQAVTSFDEGYQGATYDSHAYDEEAKDIAYSIAEKIEREDQGIKAADIENKTTLSEEIQSILGSSDEGALSETDKELYSQLHELVFKISKVLGSKYENAADEFANGLHDISTFNDVEMDKVIGLFDFLEKTINTLNEVLPDNTEVSQLSNLLTTAKLNLGKGGGSPEQLYNVIANLISFSDNVDKSIQRRVEAINRAGGNTTFDEQFEGWKKMASIEDQSKYKLSRQASDAYEKGGLAEVFEIKDEEIQRLKKSYDKYGTTLTESLKELKDGTETTVDSITRTGQQLIQQGVAYRLDTTGKLENPNLFRNSGNFTHIQGENKPYGMEGLSPANVTTLFYKGGYTALSYGSSNINESLDTASKLLNERRQALQKAIQANDKQLKNTLGAEIAVLEADIEQMQKALTPIEAVKKDSVTNLAKSKLADYQLPNITKAAEEINRKILSWDTETTSAQAYTDAEKAKMTKEQLDRIALNRLPATIGLATGQGLQGEGDYLLSYGSTKDTMQVLIEAMNLQDRRESNKLAKSSQELREKLGIQGTEFYGKDKNGQYVASEEDVKILTEYIEANSKTIDEVLDTVESLLKQLGEGSRTGGFNTQYDRDVMQNYLNRIGASDEQIKRFHALFGNDIDFMAMNSANIGDKNEAGESIASRTGKFNLQSMREMILGSKDTASHGAYADSQSMLKVAPYIQDDKIFSDVMRIAHEIAEQQKVDVLDADRTKYSSTFKEIVKIVWKQMQDKLRELGMYSSPEAAETSITDNINPEEIVESVTSDTEKPKTKKRRSTRKKKDTAETLEGAGENALTGSIIEEGNAFVVTTENILKHNEALANAIELETQKAEAAKALSEALNGEISSFNTSNEVVQQNSEKLHENQVSVEKVTKAQEENNEVNKQSDEISFKLFPVRFDSENGKHDYYDASSGDKIENSATALRDLIFKAQNAGFKADQAKIQATFNSLNEGEQLTPEMLGMTPESFSFQVHKVFAQGKFGDMFHEIIDQLAKNSVTSLEKLKEVNESVYNDLNSKLDNIYTKDMAKLGITDDVKGNILSAVSAYTRLLEEQGIDFAKLSEFHVGMETSGPQGTYRFALTPDQMMMMGGEMFSVDSKTGKVSGIETLQVALESLVLSMVKKMSMEEAKQFGITNEAYKQIQNSDVRNEFGYVADIGKGQVDLRQYKLPDSSKIYEWIARAFAVQGGTGSPLSDIEAQEAKNYAMASGHMRAVSQEEEARRSTEEQRVQQQEQLNEAIKSSVSYLEKWQKLESELYELELKMRAAQGDEQAALLAQLQSKEIEAEDMRMRYREQADIVDTIGTQVGGLTETQLRQINQGAENVWRTVDVRRQQADIHANTFITQQQKKDVQDYLKSYKELLKIQRDIYRTELRAQKATGQQKVDYETQLQFLRNRETELEGQTNNYNFDKDIYAQERLTELERERNALDQEHAISMSGITTQYDKQRTLLQMIFGTFQQSITRFFDYSGVFMLINEIKKVISDIFNYTAQLDQKIVNLQIASGESRENIKDMLGDYNKLAAEVGRTTAQVADAANDWLRAGYEGKESMELTKGSMYLSTLGLMEAGEATSALISVLKGWKLSVEDVVPVIDKLVKVDVNAAVSAGEIANAMQLVNYSAQQAGLSMDTLIGILTTNKDVTQRSAQVVGNSWKTIVARVQNVKANKFEPSDLDRAEEGFAEEDWASLNDVETVLNKVGIRLRTSAKSWRNLEDVLDEVASKWENFDDVTRSAIANAFAGTRQRENFIATIANWDKVQMYSSISENAYGTAEAKMEAYTNSVEAARNSITQAVEKWALVIDGMDAMRNFYSLIGKIVENLDTFILVLGGLMIFSNLETIVMGVINGFTSLETRLTEFGTMLQTYTNTLNGTGTTVTNAVVNSRRKGFEGQVAQLGLGREAGVAFNAAQTGVLSLNAKAAGNLLPIFKTMLGTIGATPLSGNFTNNTSVLQGFSQAGLNQQSLGIMSQLFNTKKTQDLKGNVDALLGSFDKLNREVDLTPKELTNVGANFNNLQVGLSNLNNVSPQTARALRELGVEMESVSNSGKRAWSALATAVAGIGGTVGYGHIGQLVGGDKGQMVGTMLGGLIGAQSKDLFWSGSKSIAAEIKKAGGIKQMGSILQSGAIGAGTIATTALGFAGLAAAAAGIIWKINDDAVKKSIEKAEDNFKNYRDKLETAQNSVGDASILDEYSHGVDSLGRNISLTEEEYEKFLAANNNLADSFPELISYTDSAGNHFVTLGDQASSYSETIQQLIKDQQTLADTALFSDTIKNGWFKDNIDLYDQQLQKVKKEVDEEQTKIDVAKDNLKLAENLSQAEYMTGVGIERVLGDIRQYMQDKGYIKESSQYYNMSSDILSTRALNTEGVLTYNPETNTTSVDYTKFLAKILEENDTSVDEAEDLAKTIIGNYQTGLETTISNGEANIARINRGMYNQNQALIRDLVNSGDIGEELGAYYEQASEEYKQVLDKIALNFETANFTQSEIRDSFKGIMQNLKGIFEGDNSDIITNALKGANEFNTIGESSAARQSLRKLLINNFGNDFTAWNNEQKEVAEALGFEDQNGLLWDKNDQLAQLNSTAKRRGIFNLDFSDASSDQVSDILKLMSTGTLDNIKQEVFETMLAAEGPDKKDYFGYAEYAQRMIDASSGNKLSVATANITEGLDKENIVGADLDKLNNKIDQELASFPLSVRGSIKNMFKDLKDGTVKLAEETDLGTAIGEALTHSVGELKVDIRKDLISNQLKEVFDGFDKIDIDGSGLIDTFEELKTALDSVESSFQKLKNAQEEYNTTGEISIGTMLDLITTDSAFLQVLDFSGEKLGLVDDAENQLAEAKLAATRASMQEALAQEEERAATIKNTMEAIANGDATVEIVNSTSDSIKALEQSVQALDAETTAIMSNTYAKMGNKAAESGDLGSAASYLGLVTSTAAVKTAFNATPVTSSVTFKTPQQREAELARLSAQLNSIYGGDEKWYSYSYDEDEGTYSAKFKDLTSQKLDVSSGKYNGGTLAAWQKAIDKLDVDLFKNGKYSPSSSKSSGGSKTDPFTELDRLKSLLGALNKEYYQMVVYGDMGLSNLRENAAAMHELYFDSMRSLLTRAIAQTEQVLGGMNLDDIFAIKDKDQFNKMLGYYQDMQKYEVQLRNLDDEEVQDRIKILELQNANKATLVEEYKTLTKTADTLEDCLDYQNKLYQARKTELETEAQIAEYQEKSAEDRLAIVQKELKLEKDRLVSGKEAYDYLEGNEVGNLFLDTIRDNIKSAQAKWQQADEDAKAGRISSAEAARIKEEAHTAAQLERNKVDYYGNENGLGFNAKENNPPKDDSEYQKKLKEARELEREIIENRIKRYEYDSISLELIKDQLDELYKLTQNDEQRAEINNRIKENLKQQYSLMRSMREFQNNMNNFSLNYLNPYDNAKQYDTLIQQNKKTLKAMEEDAKNEFGRLWNDVYRANLQKGLSPEEAAQEAYKNSDVQNALQNYMDDVQAIGDLAMKAVEDKLEDLTRKLDKLTNEKPQEWVAISQIERFTESTIQLYQSQLDILRDQLKDVSELTDAQVKELVDKYNTAYKAIHDAKIQALSDKISYQDRVNSAVQWSIQEQIDDLNFQKDLISKIYDDELKKLNEKNQSIERTNKLLELQNQLLDAQKTKDRVYVQGIGWTFQQNRTKVRQAQENLNSFYRQDHISDIQNTRDEELRKIEEEITGWQDYLAMLQKQYQKWEREENKNLVTTLLGADNYDEAVEMLRTDMQSYRKYMKDNENLSPFSDIKQGITGVTQELANNFNEAGEKVRVTADRIEAYTSNLQVYNDTLFSYIQMGFKGIFDTFMDTHYQYEKQYHELLREALNLIDEHAYYRQNDFNANLPNPEYTDIKDVIRDYPTLYGVVKNDASEYASGNKGNAVVDAKGYVDYSIMMEQAAQNHDILGLAYNAVLREVKYNQVYGDKTWQERGWTDTDTLLDKLMSDYGWSKSEKKDFISSMMNANEMAINAENINQKNQASGLSLLSAENQMLVAYGTLFPSSIDSNTANIVNAEILNTEGIKQGLSTSSYNMIEAFVKQFSGSNDIVENNFSNSISQNKTLAEKICDAIRTLNNSSANRQDVSKVSNISTSNNTTASPTNNSTGGSSSSSGVGGKTYNVNTETGHGYLGTLSHSEAGTTLTGGDGSKWVADGKGGVTITDKNGNTFSSSQGQITTGGNTRTVWGYSSGIESGPVTYTGLAMLHGSLSKPEYVLNSDQAYNVLKYIAAGNRPNDIIASYNNSDSGTQYVVEGDIVLEGINDPSKFWDGVTTAMGTRWNVTKKRVNY